MKHERKEAKANQNASQIIPIRPSNPSDGFAKITQEDHEITMADGTNTVSTWHQLFRKAPLRMQWSSQGSGETPSTATTSHLHSSLDLIFTTLATPTVAHVAIFTTTVARKAAPIFYRAMRKAIPAMRDTGPERTMGPHV
ncbi:uncharacterized protein N7479_010927 [Penicillium vulpinum]|uniref:Uncharacterized protein n=1 Tax=Penicillium vulpinum TaxID=29845 RepID=A0A1V6S072_9EURO|nr:uncharacterized protein N7479_010927 [Penicillium vulpinum]KAJ5952514.1 hypothetical protein N7479_010927 [Penicillium vulpinum]OQE07268.1 hypothetical protein PENVUL_c014G07619 [Penicillium vulpinum]